MKYIIILFLPLFSFSQNYSELDSFAINIPDSLTHSPPELANYISSNFTKTDDKVRIVYVWITTHIKYQETIVDSLKNDDLVIYALKTRSGICKNYSALLTSLCKLMKIEAYSVLGYTKQKNRVETKNDHAWNIIKIDNTFYLYDPTYDAGRILYSPKELSYNYYKQDSMSFILSHMPYDPVMQLKQCPITHKGFFMNKTSGTKELNFKEHLSNYSQLNESERLQALLKRTEENGINIPELKFLYQRLKYFIKNVGS
jgi:transglutaminase/protease-like cytokinesis protein 3